jgi:hypothetical protein
MSEKIKKYFPDIIIFIGVWLYLQPEIFKYHKPSLCLKGYPCESYDTDWDKIGIIIILIGVDTLIRRYLKNKK